ncbi:MAG TPA: rhodanese-like domain-containing protein [Polyangiaceae bacterium]|nr:rhodanese-like domain-containing protein [Polyangiaceae bacterium]
MIVPITPHAVQELLAGGEIEVVDVREAHEWATGHIPGARRVGLNELRNNPKGALPRDGVVFVCAAGVRSETAARIALSNGLTRVYNLTSGMRGWAKLGLPLALPELAAAV